MNNNENTELVETQAAPVSDLEAELTMDIISNRPEWVDVWMEVAQKDAKFFANLA